MQPMYEEGDVLLCRTWGKPQKGDIVLAYIEELGYTVVKRVVATEGDAIVVLNGELYVNGEKVGAVLEYLTEQPVKVPQEKYFLLGDNQKCSLDSRKFGFVNRKDIRGTLIKKLY